MTAPDLLAALRARGYRLECRAVSERTFRLVVTPAAGLTQEDKILLTTYKEDLLSLLYPEWPLPTCWPSFKE